LRNGAREMAIFLITNKFYSWQEFLQLSVQEIGKLQLRCQQKIFKAGVSFLAGDLDKVTKQLNNYSQHQIPAFAVEDKQKRFVTIYHQIPHVFNEHSQDAIVILNQKKSEASHLDSTEKVQTSGFNSTQKALECNSNKNNATVPTLPPKPKVIAEREDSSRKRLQYRGKRY